MRNLLIMAFILLLTNTLAGAQNQSETSQPATTVATQEEVRPEIEWVWGEVVSVDNITNQIAVKSLDYETYEEKVIVIGADEKTTYENVTSLLEIKPTDEVSIDYVITKDGKNLAKNISKEKPAPDEADQ